ncbi:MAG: hypothetical protein H0X42_06645 [Solirubrobacterales bacterium]|nr:hypothetical protein [Solirubrobacterales bacterium]
MKPVGLALLVAVAATALSASTAPATTIAPVATKVHAISTETRFLPNNAFSELAVVCKATSGGKLTTPEEGALKKNQNKTGVGTFSAGPGSVNTVFTETPKFEKCEVLNLKTGKTELAATVSTNETNGKWEFSGVEFEAAKEENDKRVGLIGVPKGAATISLTGTTCVLTVSPEESSVVSGEWTNGTNSTTAPSTIRVDEQLAFSQTAGCAAFGLVSPAQFEATYNVTVEAGGAVPVTIKR